MSLKKAKYKAVRAEKIITINKNSLLLFILNILPGNFIKCKAHKRTFTLKTPSRLCHRF